MANHLARISASVICQCVRNNQRVLQRAPALLCQSQRLRSTEAAIAPPHIEGTEKEYPQHIRNIVDEISKLNLLEVADLNELLKKTLNISDAPMMSMGAMPAAAAPAEEEDEAPAQAAPSLYTVKLISFDAGKKVALIKEIKNLIAGMNLVQAKKFVESAPAEVKKDLTKDEAEELKKALEAVGGTAEMEN